MTNPQQTSDIYGILPDSTGQRVLMLLDESGVWTLLHVHLPDRRLWVPQVDIVRAGMQTRLKTGVIVLRNVYARYSDEPSHADLIYVLEMLDNDRKEWTVPERSKWIDQGELENLPLAHPEHRAVIEICLCEAETNVVPPLRPPWSSPGWFQMAAAWMRDQLAVQDYVLIGPVEQFKSWGISCLLRAPTNRGNIFFKVSTLLPLFGNEPAVLEALSARYPEYVPAPFAINAEQRWMLMCDYGAELRTNPTLEQWEAVMRRFGQLQNRATSAIDDLLAIGCLDRRPAVLAAQIDPLLDDADALALMTTDERTRLRALAPRLKAMCAELAAYRVPCTLNHGDLHSGNITAQKLLFFDWTDACIAHPFLDLSTVMMDFEEHFPGGRERIENAYLNLWSAYEPMDRLRELWTLAEPLGALHQAVSYQHILTILEPTSKQQMITGVPTWLRQVMKTMHA